jgi:hypothetical protein
VPQTGDANGDGVLNDDDILDLIEIFVSGQDLTPEQLEIMDVNKDGEVTPQDAQDLWLQIHGNG